MDRMADYTEEQAATIGRLEHDLGERMSARPQRLAHSLSVAHTAEEMALLYGVDAFQARVAGILHDWDKALTTEELKADAHAMGIDLGVDMSLVIPLLHGLTAARRLRSSYPELPEPVFAAIERHTMAAVEMAPLDQVLFVADGIEPLRGDAKGIREVRELVGVASSESCSGDPSWEASSTCSRRTATSIPGRSRSTTPSPSGGHRVRPT